MSNLRINVVSLTISLSAFALALWQGLLQRENFHKSVQPYISVVPTISHKEREVGFYLYNSGTGPGYLDSISIFVNGKLIKSSTPTTGFKELAFQIGIDPDCLLVSYPRPGDPVTQNKLTPMLAISTVPEPICIVHEKILEQFIRQRIAQVDITVTYYSIYGDKFIYRMSSNENRAL